MKNVKVGGSAIFGIAYNTTHYGYSPIGQSATCFSTSAGCGYDSLNVALTEDPTNVSAGTSVVPGKLWLASSAGGQYADGGAAGAGTFRIDSPNVAPWWGVNSPYGSSPWYVPSIKVYANQTGDGGSSEKPSTNKVDHNSSDGKHGIKRD